VTKQYETVRNKTKDIEMAFAGLRVPDLEIDWGVDTAQSRRDAEKSRIA